MAAFICLKFDQSRGGYPASGAVGGGPENNNKSSSPFQGVLREKKNQKNDGECENELKSEGRQLRGCCRKRDEHGWDGNWADKG